MWWAQTFGASPQRDRWLGLLAAIASALLLVVAQPPHDLPEAAWLCLVPLLLWLGRRRPLRQAMAAGWLSGLLSWLLILRWLPGFSLHLGGWAASVLGWLALIALASVLALFTAGWAAIAAWLLRRAPHENPALWDTLRVLAIAGAWVVIEWLRSWIVTGFPWAPLALSQWDRPLVLQLAAYTGAWGVSFVLVAFNVALYCYLEALPGWRSKRWWQRVSAPFYVGFALLALTVGIGLNELSRIRPAVPLFRAGFVQPNLAAPEKWDAAHSEAAFADLARVTQLAALLQPDLILWPEATTPYPVKGFAPVERWVNQLAAGLGMPLLIGNVAVERPAASSTSDPGQPGAGNPAPSDDAERWYNAVFWVSPTTGVHTAAYYAKRHLVPFGEYVPRWLPLIDKVIPLDGAFYAGTDPAVFIWPHNGRRIGIGALICFEDIFPRLARSSVLAGADVLYVATNNAWFGEGAGAWQHAAHSVLRAVENRRPVMRCGNAGWSGWIDPFGFQRHVMTDARGSIYFQGADSALVSHSGWWLFRQSWYTRFGDWFVAVCGVLAGGLSYRNRRWRRAES
jgi:apolipoprotein N-acyltransferase